MLEGVFGNRTTEKVLLSLYLYGETYVSAIAKDFRVAENPIRAQLDRLEQTGIIHSKQAGALESIPLTRKAQILVVRGLKTQDRYGHIVLYNSI